MYKGSTLFLKLAVLLLGGLVCLFGVIMIPKISSLAAFLFPDQIFVSYFVFLILSATIIPFVYAIYQTWQLLTFIDHQNAFSEFSVRTLKRIKLSALSLVTLYIIGMPFFYMVADADDAPGFLLIAIVFLFAAAAIGVFAAILQALLQEAMRYKSEYDWTV
ncbi:DUF2975 domain-containing protein [Alkalibacter rhizosphaerae]|uniref:DUF2975 domain-containing protein n=1 Tax=Alkalibacter rhizosphaerae TaxID=2815577 RepID=A0A974XM42_9FIRM|nr:DUF2975 domain-containing protein [Alkalibacter rhizosphaerae]QSX08461.1 DUF2975 domain-containing protein [Alkalibacter rhizosphaerae]